MNLWIILTVIYALCVGIFELGKKKSMEKISLYDTLAGFSVFALIGASIINRDMFLMDYKYLPLIILKTAVIVVSWILCMKALKNMLMSTYGVTRLSQIIYTLIMSILILGEHLTGKIIIGAIITIIGLVLVNLNKDSETENNTKNKNNVKYIILLLIGMFFSACSGVIDKVVLKNITSSQLQFWFLFLLTISYWTIALIKQRRVEVSKIIKNKWLYISAIAVLVGDRCLFIANENPDSMISIMSIIKQLSAVESVFLGKIFFNEKNIIKKLFYSVIVISGIIVIFI